MDSIKRLLHHNQKGQGTLEYAGIVLVVVSALIALLLANPISSAVSGAFERATGNVSAISTS